MALATPQNVETALMRDLTETESRYVADLLETAERKLTARASDLLTRAANDFEFAALVADVEAEMLARVLRAPDSGIYKQEMEGNYSYGLNLQVASGLLDVLDKEWKLLGMGEWSTVAPATDGYLSTRAGGLRPDLRFQYGWGGGDQMAEVVW